MVKYCLNDSRSVEDEVEVGGPDAMGRLISTCLSALTLRLDQRDDLQVPNSFPRLVQSL